VTQGRRVLLAVLQVIPGREVASRVRVHESNVSRWASGDWRPSERARYMLEEHCRIPACLWESDSPSSRDPRARSW
jgi:transcriptional regulator with XRE-family HTH domain